MQQANFLLPDDLLKEFRKAVPRGEQSAVVGAALRRELMRRRLQAALADSFGSWKRPTGTRSTRALVRSLRRDRPST